MSRHKKTFAPRAGRSDKQKTNNKEDKEKSEQITDQDSKISLAKTEVTQITYVPFRNRAFKKIEKGSSSIQFSNSGLHVLALNNALNALGHNVPENEVSFGDKTKIALINFQQQNGITGSGIFDKETLLKMNEVTKNLDEGETIRKATLPNKKAESDKRNKGTSEPASLLESKLESHELFQSSFQTGKDPIKLKKCNPEHALDYCLIVSFIPTTNIPKGNTIEGYVIYYQAVYGGSKENAIKVAERWGEDGRINFAGEIKAGAPTNVNVPLEKYLDNLFFGAPKNESAREALKQKLLGIVDNDKDKKNEKEINREELNKFLTNEYSKITEDSEYIALKNKLKSLKAPELSPKGKKAAALLEKTPKNSEAQDILIEEFEKFGKEMALYMLQINRKLILTEAERHGIWLPYGEHKNKLQELKTGIEAYKKQMTAIQASLPSFKEQQKLYQEAYDAVGRDPYATDIHDQKINKASGIERKYSARNEIYRSIPILSIGDDFNNKGLKAEKQEWAPDWENFDFKTDEQIITDLKNSIITQLEKINEAEENIIDEDLDFIWDLGELIPISIQQAGISSNKNAVKVIQDKVRQEAKYELIKNIILIAGGIILSIVSLGQATPFLLAILASGGTLAISTYYVKQEIHDYNLNRSLYDASIQVGQVLQGDDPSLAWLVLAIAGAALDAGSLAKILRSAKPISVAAKAFNDADDATKALATLESDLLKIEGLEIKVRENIIKQAKIQAQQQKILAGFVKARQLTYVTIPGLAQTGELLARAVFAIRKGIVTFDSFVAELKLAKLISDTGLTPEQLLLVKNTFEKAKTLAKDDKLAIELEKAMADNDLVKVKSLLEETEKIKGEKPVKNTNLDESKSPKEKETNSRESKIEEEDISIPSSIKTTEQIITEASDKLSQIIPGLSKDQATFILKQAFSRNSSVIFGGSRIRGNYTLTSDLDVGFGQLTSSQAGKIIKSNNAIFDAGKIEGWLKMETTKIIPGNETKSIERITTPEDFFQRSGVRSAEDAKAGEAYGPSGSITVEPDGNIFKIDINGNQTNIKLN